MKKIWNGIILAVAIIIILTSALTILESLLIKNWNQVVVNIFIVLLVAYGLYRKFWQRKEKNIQENNKKKTGGAHWE